MSSKNGKALERGRARFPEGAPYTPADTALLLAAGLDPTFDPASNVIDAKIERYLGGVFGIPWRERIKPRAPRWTPEEARAIAAAEAVAAAKRSQLQTVTDEWFLAEDDLRQVAHANLPPNLVLPNAAAQQLAAVTRRATELAKRHSALSEELERATGALNDLKLAAQERAAQAPPP
jgi:hypothetical protein